MCSLFSRVALAVLILVPATALGQNISFRAEAQSVPKLIQAINEEFKTNYSASKAMESDIVCVQVTDVSLDDLLTKIAEVTAASWLRRGGVLTLEPSKKLRAAEVQAEIKTKKANFERQLANYERTWQRQGIDPKLGAYLPLDEIAKQTAWSTKVFAVSPTRQQSRLSRSTVKMMGTEWMRNRRRSNSRSQVTIGPYDDLHLISRQISSGVQLTIEATDAQGAAISATNLMLTSRSSFRRSSAPENIDDSKAVRLSPMQRAFATLWNNPAQQQSDFAAASTVMKSLTIDASLRPQIEKILIDPVSVDPLSVYVSPVLNQAALLDERDLVALLPDVAVQLGYYVMQSKVLESSYALRYLVGSALATKSDGSWLLLTPSLPAQSRTDRMDRQNLKLLVNDVRKTGAIDPVALTDVLPKSAMTEAILLNGYIGYFDVGVAGTTASAFGNQHAVYYALSTIPRQYLLELLRNRRSVTVETLSGSLKKAVTRNVFDRRLPVYLIQENLSRPGTIVRGSAVTFRLSATEALSGGGQVFRSSRTSVSPPIEITDLLPQGVTSLTIEIVPSESRMIQGRSLSRGLVQRSSLSQMATAAANAQYGRTSQRTDGMLIAEEYMQVEQRNWTITYRLANGMFATTRVGWIEPDFKGGWKLLAEFDKPFLDSYNQLYRRAMTRAEQQQQGNSRRRGGGNRIPPPE